MNESLLVCSGTVSLDVSQNSADADGTGHGYFFKDALVLRVIAFCFSEAARRPSDVAAHMKTSDLRLHFQPTHDKPDSQAFGFCLVADRDSSGAVVPSARNTVGLVAVAAGAVYLLHRWYSSDDDFKPGVVPERRVRALYSFEADAAFPGELTVRENEELVCVAMSSATWWTCRNARGEQGRVPAQFVALV